jgi:hypothetical protein
MKKMLSLSMLVITAVNGTGCAFQPERQRLGDEKLIPIPETTTGSLSSSTDSTTKINPALSPTVPSQVEPQQSQTNINNTPLILTP